MVGKLASMLNCIQSFIFKEYARKASVGVAALPGGERVQALAGDESKDVERVTGRGSYTA